MRDVLSKTIMKRIESAYEELDIGDAVHINDKGYLTIAGGQPYFGLPYFNIIGGKRQRRSIRKRRTNKHQKRY